MWPRPWRRLGAYYDISVDDFREIYAQVWEIARKRLLHAISAAQIMTSPPLTVRVGQNLRQVLELFAARNITGLPVLDEEGKLCGVISEKDVSRVLCGTESGFSALALLTVLKRNVAELGKKLELRWGGHELAAADSADGLSAGRADRRHARSEGQPAACSGSERSAARHCFAQRYYSSPGGLVMLSVFLSRLRGGKQAPPRAPWGEIVWAWIGSCLSMACLAGLERLSEQEWHLPLLIGSFGASAVLAFGASQSPLAQPAQPWWAAILFRRWWA